MTYVITHPCIDILDRSCLDVCPVDCIIGDDGVDRMLYIDPSECIDCGACVPACPVDAIFAEEDLPPGSEEFIQLNRLYFLEKGAAQARVVALAPAVLAHRTQ
ncbi:MAG: ferredoxin [Acidimicrobiales bacterium]|nr:MAG: ferredoxin [Acidimicrobiales bacterium]